MSVDAFREMQNKIRRELSAHPDTSGGEILSIDNDPDTGDLLITSQFASGQRTQRIIIKDETVDVPRETSPSVEDKFTHQVDVIYQVNSGALRTAQRTVQARDAQEAVDWVRAQLTAAFKNDTVSFGNFDVRVVPDGGPVVNVPRETSTGRGETGE
jgi:hypothetical protein